MHELSLLAGLADGAVRAEDEDLGVRDRLADGIRTTVDLGRVEVGRAERLGETVHEVGRRTREGLPQAVERAARHPSTGVGPVSQARRDRFRPRHRHQLQPQWRHAREPCHPVLLAQAHDVARQQIVHEHAVRADGECRRDLAESGVETQRQHAQDDVVARVVQIGADALGPHDEIAVAQHDALRLARAPGGVEDGRGVEVDGRRGVAARRKRQSLRSPRTPADATPERRRARRRGKRRRRRRSHR